MSNRGHICTAVFNTIVELETEGVIERVPVSIDFCHQPVADEQKRKRELRVTATVRRPEKPWRLIREEDRSLVEKRLAEAMALAIVHKS
jgi:hypothetical protein